MVSETTKHWGKSLAILLLVTGFLVCAYVLAGHATGDPGYQDDSGLPTPPPPLPQQIVNGDGTRMNCTPTLSYCWPAR